MVGSKDLQPSTKPFFPREFFKHQYLDSVRRLPSGANLSGHVAIITGANTGLGFEAASQLLSYGLSHLILAVRSPSKGDAAAKLLKERHPESKIEVWIVDMSSYDSIRAFCSRANNDLTRLDIVILNAGVGNVHHKITPSTGHEEIIQVNYLSTTLMTILLLPILKARSPVGKPGQLTMIGSALALGPDLLPIEKPILGTVDDANNFNPRLQYGRSKLLNQMFLWKLVDFVSADDVVVNMVDPGLVKGTELGRGLHGMLKVVSTIFSALAAKSVKAGAATYLDAAVTKDKDSHGMLIIGYEYHAFNPLLYTSENKSIEDLWEETLDELSFIDPLLILSSMIRD